MRIVSEAKLTALLGALPGVPRVVAGGNFATPWQALALLDAAIAEYRLSPPPRPAHDASVSIGDRVAALVRDGATLQLGIGVVPDAVLAALSARRGLRVWSEMFQLRGTRAGKGGSPGLRPPDHRVLRVR